MKDASFYLNHILQRCEKLERISASVSAEEFYADEDIQDIVIRSLQIIGDASANLSEEFRESHAHIPWRKIKNFRNILVHQYFRIDMRSVWGTVVEDVPTLRKHIESIMEECA